MAKFIGKIIIWNLSFMKGPITGRLIEVTDQHFLIEMRDGRMLVARLDCILGFGMAKKQPASEV